MTRTSLARRLVLACIVAAALPAAAQTYPTKPIRVIVPYAAGGSTDQLARAIQQPMSDLLGQPVIIDNRPGAGGTIGTDMVAKAAPDGYTLVFGNTGPSAVVSMMRKTPYDELKDFRPISTVAITPMILAVPADIPVTTAKEFVAWVGKHPNLNYGSVGNGSLSHMTGEYFNSLAGTRLTHIPYNGGAPLTTAFVGGQVQASFVTGLDGATMLATGKVKYLAVGTPQRTPVVPGLPAIAEEIPGFRSSAWFGLLAPKGTPDEIVAKLNAAVVAAVRRPEIQKLFASRNVEARSSTPAEMEALIRDEIAQWKPVIRDSKIEM
ncbi:Bug family tripartite tricarboxylate transporter substrate binding protein [Piscinibacter koreensis]|uniref:Tripartite tricarboxylate transporter substrate binding protein n=1 Tax=Piscinibacter koreensis TaxID=2742824 RepID=A0A7Y6NMZ7_9BURK|nr:tripartite tricarboxylate transporter substrate binding protein [Schlegelella koreensis]NUZ06135.1 tripartite tricarboxylate transporter substrate binding protein [Schlegelella koreensis]